MPPRTVVIGVDSSTQSTKAAVTDAVTGEILAVGRAPHVVLGEGGARESDPEIWWQALRDAVAAGMKEAGVPASAVTGIAVAYQQHGLVVLDRGHCGRCGPPCSGTTPGPRPRPPPSPPRSAAPRRGPRAPDRSPSPR